MSTNIIRDIVLYSELLAAITGTIYLHKYKHTQLKYFLLLLWYIVFTELFAIYARKTGTLIFYADENGNNYTTWFYNLLGFVTFTSLFYIYYNYLYNIKYKKWIKFFSGIYIITYIINWVFIQNFFRESATLPDVLGSIFLVITIIFFFIELLRSEKVVVFHRMLLFWISIGLLLFYAGTTPFILEYNGYKLIPGIHKLFYILYVLAIVMYLIFTFGFIWSKKEQH